MNLFILFIVLIIAAFAQKRSKPFPLTAGNYRIYAYDIVFRETPWSQFAPAGVTDSAKIGVHSHFIFDFNSCHQLQRVQKVKNGVLEPNGDRWLNASVTEINYENEKETHIYFNEYGSRTIASGNVYRSEFQLKNGKRSALHYFDVNGKRVSNLYSVAEYKWLIESDSTVIETRSNRENQPVEIRSQIDFYTTKFTFKSNGLLKYMDNWDLDRNKTIANSSGIHRIKIIYDANNYMTNWINYDDENQKRIGTTGVAEINYIRNERGEEQIAKFFDGDSKPMRRWGIYQIAYRHDEFGNAIEAIYQDANATQIARTDGIASRRYEWTKDGLYQSKMISFDIYGKPINHPRLNYAVYQRDISNQLIREFFLNANQQRVVLNQSIYEIQNRFDGNGNLIEVAFLNEQLEPVMNWDNSYSRLLFSYSKQNKHELESVRYFNDQGKEVQINDWNPAH